jgi:O-antigen/teichoic acid export membrane protein
MTHTLAGDQGSTKRLFARATVWTLVRYALSQGIRLAGNLILWRLLYAEAFGLMAIVNVVFQGLWMFSDVGIAQAVVQSEKGDSPEYLNTIWTIQAMRGLVVCAIAMMAAAPLAAFYGQPDLGALIPIAAISSAIGGFASTKLFSANRRIALARLTLIELTSQAAGLFLMIAWAYHTRSVWSLAFGGVLQAGVRTVLSHMALPGTPNRLRWDREAAKAVSSFGRWVLFSSTFGFLASCSDRLVFGKFVPMDRLGVYSVGSVWATIPIFVAEAVKGSVLFPLLSRARNQGDDVAQVFAQTRAPVLTASAWLNSCLLAGGPTLIRFLYDERAAEAGWVIQTLCIGAWFSALESGNSAMMLALGNPAWLTAANAGKFVTMVGLMILGAKLYGFPGAVLGFSLSEAVKFAITKVGVVRSRFGGSRLDLVLTFWIGGTAAAGSYAPRVLRIVHCQPGSTRLEALVEGLVMLVTVSVVWVFVYKTMRPGPAATTHRCT